MAQFNNIAGTARSLKAQLWFVLVRSFIVSLLLGVTLLFNLTLAENPQFFFNTRLVIILSLYLLQICFSLFWLLRYGPSPIFVQLQIVWDLIVCSAVVYVTGGMYSEFAFLFVFVILSSGLISSRNEVLIVLLASIVLYGGLATLDFYGYLPVYPWQARSGSDVFYTLFMNFAAFVLAAFIGVVLSTRLQQSAHRIEQQQRKHSELEEFNRQVLQHISSGLILVDPEGYILLLNKVAEQICAIHAPTSLKRHIISVLPGFAWPPPTVPLERAEMKLCNADKKHLILGYSITPIYQAEATNMLLMFQDLTEIKRLEQRLRHEQHMASIGSLSAGLAHEIRNPLASVGGSIQLLEERIASDRDKRLLGIVQRETKRLNTLVNDFLNFANPRQPMKRQVKINSILAELIQLAKQSETFASIQIDIDLPENWYEDVDEEQIRQLGWNLLTNAANFSPPDGHILCGADKQTRSFWIEDNGPGIDPMLGDTIFEPFTTSRAEGTGLGLSIAHALSTANGAILEYESSSLGGARFSVTFTT